jgi:HTH-type transcriptional regulator/antitoxin MqsA
MKCPSCKTAELVQICNDMPYTYKGEKMIIRGVTGEWCPSCGEALLDMSESARISRDMRTFNQKVNKQLFSPQEIVKVRERLHLTQQEAATLFGGGVNAFSRYESGKTKPPVALVKLLRLLDKYPELLDELRFTT